MKRLRRWIATKLRRVADKVADKPPKPYRDGAEHLWYLPASQAGRDDLPAAYPARVSGEPQPAPWIGTTRAEYELLRQHHRTAGGG